MKRRRFAILMILAGSVLAALAGTEAQQASNIRRVGVLSEGPDARPVDWASPLKAAFRQRMSELGYTEGRNVVFHGWRGRQEQFPDFVADLLSRQVEVIVAWGAEGVVAAKRATTSVPIVIASSPDAVEMGLVASLARPSGNVTGVSFQTRELFMKRFEIVREIVPGASRIGVLWASTAPSAPLIRAVVADIAKTLQIHVELLEVPTPADLDKAFAALRRGRVAGVLVVPISWYADRPDTIAMTALRHRLVTVFMDSGGATAGGLIVYSVPWRDMARKAADYVDRILKGANPADLPVEQPTKFDIVINLKTAKALGLTIPPSVLLRADRVIE